jgi:hypothetical protein
MKITIDHDSCHHGGAFADRCLAATIRYPLRHERFCMAQMEDDERNELTVVLIFDGQDHTLVLRDEAEQEAVALEGWTAFLPTVAGG